MGVVARNNLPTIQSFSDAGTRVKTTVYADGRPTVVTTTSTGITRMSHYKSRSANVKVPLTGIGGMRKIRGAGSFARKVMDSPFALSQRVTCFYLSNGKLDKTETTVEPHIPPYADIDLSSGAIGGFCVVGSDDAVNQALTQVLNKLGDQKVNIGAALAESKKTLDMIADATTAIFKSYRAMRKGRWTEVAKSLGLNKRDFYSGSSSANYLLAVKYGVVPLLGDIYNGYNWFADNNKTPLLLEAKSMSKRTSKIHGTAGSHTWNGEATQIGYCGIKAKVSGDFARGINQGGLSNPVLIGWELVPFSFVVDWFIPVGNVLQAYSAHHGLTFISGYTGESNESSVEVTRNYVSITSLSSDTIKGSSLVRSFSTKRTPLAVFPRPGLYAKQNVFNADKATTALALLRSAMR